jgi:hypothetical protein
MGGGGVLVEICNLVFRFFSFMIYLDFHVREREARTGKEEVIFEDFCCRECVMRACANRLERKRGGGVYTMEMGCSQDLRSVVSKTEEVFKDAAGKAGAVCY